MTTSMSARDIAKQFRSRELGGGWQVAKVAARRRGLEDTPDVKGLAAEERKAVEDRVFGY